MASVGLRTAEGLGAVVASTALIACGSSSNAGPGAGGGDGTGGAGGAAAVTCSLGLNVDGFATYSAMNADEVACASELQGPPGATILFLPIEADVVKGFALGLPTAEPGVTGSALSTVLTVELPDNSSATAGGCETEITENTLYNTEALGDRYLLHGTGSCTDMPASPVKVNGTFSFIATMFWTR